MKRYILVLLSLLITQLGLAQVFNVIEPELQELLDRKDDDMVSVNIILKSEININNLRSNVENISDIKLQRQAVVSELKAFARQSQQDVMSLLEAGKDNGEITDIKTHWLSNMITCTASKDYVYMLSEHPDIKIIGHNDSQFLLWDEKSTDVEPQRGVAQNIKHVYADKAWKEGLTGKGILVGVIDTGVNFHKDLEKNLWDGGEEYPNHGYNTYENSHDVSDGFNHGTHVAGTIAGDGTSGTQTGVAPDATIMCIKVMNDAGQGDANSVCSGIEFAIEHGADVLNMSLGFPLAKAATKEALRQTYVNALEANVAIVTAVGNDGMLNLTYPVPNSVRVPGSCPPPWLHPDQQANPGGLSACIAVSAVDGHNNVADFASKGPVTWQTTSYEDYPYLPGREIGLIRPDVCAPGVGIISCSNSNSSGYASMDGTSQATPCVTGVVCLMLQKKNYLTPAQICEALETTAKKLSDTKSNETGSGCINAMSALDEIEDYKDISNINDMYENNIDIYPNPAYDNVFVETEGNINEITIYNLYGQQTTVNRQQTTSSGLIINVEHLNPGIYIVKINTNKGNIVKQFIKQ